jgi:hypothetical protein
MTSIALSMTGADLLKLRKKRSTLIWALVLALLPIVIFYAVNAIEHASDASHEAAGGIGSFHDGVRLLGGVFFGPLVAILIGVEAGTSDSSAALVWRCSPRGFPRRWRCAGRSSPPPTC